MTKAVYIATEADAGMRIDALLAAQGCFASRSAAARALESGAVLVDGAPVSKKHQVREGARIEFDEPDSAPASEPELLPYPLDLDIRYEDDDLAVLSKPAGLVCHTAPGHGQDTLANALIYRYGINHLCRVQGEGTDRPGIVHRLDKDTSGLMVVAKTDEAGRALMDAIRNREVDRHYLALVHGCISGDSGKIDAPLSRHPVDRTRMAVSSAPAARSAVTTFRVLQRFEPARDDRGFTLLDCKLLTGRTHQIRVHMDYAGYAVAGDPVYRSSAGSAADPAGLCRQFLHSYRLSFDHPRTGERLDFLEQAAEDLRNIADALAPRGSDVTEYGQAIFEGLALAPVPACERCAASRIPHGASE